jgi:hypothetical protein
MSLVEESTVAANRPMMGVFSNLVVFDQHVPQNSPKSIVPDLATTWSWNEEGTELTLPLRHDVGWHDGRPFTAKDVVCTWDLLAGKSAEKLRINPRQSWYENLQEISTKGDYEVTFHLKRAQTSFLSLLASGWPPIYPCHVPPREMRQHPIGTGPFKFVSFKPNQSITVIRNPDYWKKGCPIWTGSNGTSSKTCRHALWPLSLAGRPDLWSDDPGFEAGQERGAAGDLRRGHSERQPQSSRQPREASFRQCRYPPGDVTDSGSQSLYRHPL